MKVLASLDNVKTKSTKFFCRCQDAELETVVAPSIVATLANAGPDSELIYVRCVPERSTPPVTFQIHFDYILDSTTLL